MSQPGTPSQPDQPLPKSTQTVILVVVVAIAVGGSRFVVRGLEP